MTVSNELDLAALDGEAAQEVTRLSGAVASLEGQLAAAVAASDFEVAHGLQVQVTAAREKRAVALAYSAALSEQVRVVGQRGAGDREAVEAKRRQDQAEEDIASSRAAETHHRQECDAALALMWAAVDEARSHYAVAVGHEQEVDAARHRVQDARNRLSGHEHGGGPIVTGCGLARSRLEHDPVLRALILGRV